MIFPYIINTALVLGACLAFYKLLLRRETFYKVNRWVLIICLAVSFALPLLQVPQQFSFRQKEKDEMITIQPPSAVSEKSGNVSIDTKLTKDDRPTGKITTQTAPMGDGTPLTIINPVALHDADVTGGMTFSFDKLFIWIFILYWFGVIVFGAGFLFQIILLLYRSYRNPVIIDGNYRIVEVSGDKAPCSFGNTIFINPSLYDWETYNQILLHEKIHISQKHTADIILAELVLIFQWFNPFAWIYRREIEYNLEFLTDDQLVQHKEVDKQRYQLSLVKVSAPRVPLKLTNNYNQSILKKRIAMMNKKRSNLHTGWKYFFLLPVLAFVASLLNEPVANSQQSPKDGKTENAKNTNVNANGNANENAKGSGNENANAANKNANEKNTNRNNAGNHGIETEGYWFAIIKDDKVNIRFSDEKIDNDEVDFKSGRSYNATTFKLSELGTLPQGTSGTFSILREAGKMEMTGKFDGNTGMGRYKFIADKTYSDYMSKELGEKLDDGDEMAFFFINIRKDYLQMLKNEGFSKVTKDDIIPMAAMKIDATYIKSIKDAGFKEVTLENLVPLKALNVDAAYIKEIRDAGYKNVTTDQLVSFKAQGIDKEYIAKVRQLRTNDGKDDDADDIVSFKAMGIDEAYINSFKAAGITNIPNDQLVSFKAIGVTPEYIKSWHALGFKDIHPEEFVGMKSQGVTPEFMKSFTDLGYKNVNPESLVAFKALGVTPEYIQSWQSLGFKDIDLDDFTGMKSQGVTPEFMKSFTDMGYKNVKPENLVAFKALGITPEYVRSFEAAGYKNIDLDEMTGLKAQDVTPDYIKKFEALGFKNIQLEEIVAVKAVGVTPEYIKDMRSKGFNYDKLEKYVRLKTID